MRKLNGLELQVIEEYLSGQTPKELGLKYGTSNVTIYNTLIRHGISRRNPHEAKLRYPYDEHFFDKIDTEQKAYVLGLWYADGTNHESTNSIHLCLKDVDLVYTVKALFDTEHPVYTSRTDYAAFVLHGKHISSTLARLGCRQQKSLTATFPTEMQVPKELMPHFIRGYFDGDGCIHIRKQGWNKVVHICGTEAFLSTMATYLPVRSFLRPRHKKPIWFLAIYRMEDIDQFRDWMYLGATVWLERKRFLFFKQNPVLAAGESFSPYPRGETARP